MADDAEDRNGGSSWTERARTPPERDSPFYVPPPSIKALRWSIVILLVIPTILAFAVLLAALDQNWTAAAIAGIFLCVYGALRVYQVREVMRELGKRHAEEAGSAGGPRDRTEGHH